MEKNAFLGELLYSGFVIEKGRCKSSGFWPIWYKKILIIHFNILKKITECLIVTDISIKDFDVLMEFAEISKKHHKRIGKCYNIDSEILKRMEEKDNTLFEYVDNNSDSQINQLIIDLIDETLSYLNAKEHLNKKKIHILIRALHNLPIYYLKEDNSFNGTYRQPISKEIAIKSSFNNMDNELKQKYEKFIFALEN